MPLSSEDLAALGLTLRLAGLTTLLLLVLCKPPARRRVPLEQAVELLGIGHLPGRRTHALSGGERQCVAIARALAASPR